MAIVIIQPDLEKPLCLAIGAVGGVMGSHPINLAIRFLLEVSALIAMGMWGWRQSEGWVRLLLALSIPLIAAVVWGNCSLLSKNQPKRQH